MHILDHFNYQKDVHTKDKKLFVIERNVLYNVMLLNKNILRCAFY